MSLETERGRFLSVLQEKIEPRLFDHIPTRQEYAEFWEKLMRGPAQPCCISFAWFSDERGVNGHHPRCRTLQAPVDGGGSRP